MCKAHISFIVKNTFIAIDESEDAEATAPSDLRKRATTADVATLAYDTLHLECSEEEAEEEEEEDASCTESRPWSTVCPEVMEALEQGALSPSEILSQIEGCIKALALDPAGSALLRSLLNRLSAAEARQIAREFRGWVVEAVQHQGSAQVLARLVSILPSREVAFISQELKGQGLMPFLACTLGGAELLSALFQSHWLLQEEVRELSWELMNSKLDLASLCCHKHGYLVVLPLVRGDCQQYQELILKGMLGNIQRFARHRYASQVLAHLLTSVPMHTQEAIASAVMSAAGAVVALACHAFGQAVVRAMLEVPSAQKRMLHYIQKSSVRISKDKFGAELLRDLGFDIKIAAAVGGA